MYKLYVLNKDETFYSFFEESKDFEEIKMISVGLSQEFKKWYILNKEGEISGFSS